MGLFDNSGSEIKGRRVHGERRNHRDAASVERRKQSDRRKKSDRRADKRIYKKVTARFRLFKKDIQEKWDILFLENIGAGGVLFKLNQELKIGELVDLSISFPGAYEAIAVKAKVIRVRKGGGFSAYEIATHFVETDPAGLALINQEANKFYNA